MNARDSERLVPIAEYVALSHVQRGPILNPFIHLRFNLIFNFIFQSLIFLLCTYSSAIFLLLTEGSNSESIHSLEI